ncbi:MAG: hypothetical protein KC636_10715 [Myxococcales bacterium]|nr:hypothetical protein [Myxococcales bacterium]
MRDTVDLATPCAGLPRGARSLGRAVAALATAWALALTPTSAAARQPVPEAAPAPEAEAATAPEAPPGSEAEAAPVVRQPEDPGIAVTQPPAPEATAPAESAPEGPSDATAEELGAVTHEDRVKAEKLRRAGVGVMIAGGVLAAAGLGVTLGFTIRANQLESREAATEDIDQANMITQIGGGVLAGGIAMIAVGGVLLVTGKRRLHPPETARVSVSPTLGGVLLRGRF